MTDSDVTRLLHQAGEGDAVAQERLLARIYDELRRQAGARMRAERPGHTLQPTALVHEAYLRLISGESDWENRAHFFGAAAEAMRRVLVEHARKRASLKRGAGAGRVTFDELQVAAAEESDTDVLAMHEALDALESHDARLADVVKLRYFAGMTVEETADLLRRSPATIKRDWTYARAWLYERMSR